MNPLHNNSLVCVSHVAYWILSEMIIGCDAEHISERSCNKTSDIIQMVATAKAATSISLLQGGQFSCEEEHFTNTNHHHEVGKSTCCDSRFM